MNSTFSDKRGSYELRINNLVVCVNPSTSVINLIKIAQGYYRNLGKKTGYI